MDVLTQCAGGILIVAGLAMWSIPLAIIVLGVLVVLLGYGRELKSLHEKELADGSREPTAIDDPTRYT